jgi:hypothetical protein
MSSSPAVEGDGGRRTTETADVWFGQGVFVVMSASFSSSWALRNDDSMQFPALCSDLEGGSACAGETKSSRGIENVRSTL